MSEPFLGEIRQGGWNFAPRGNALCNGQTLSIAQNAALFSLLGTTYGGNGTTTFQLPDLQGRHTIHQGSGPGLSTYVLGEKAGTESGTLLLSNLPLHTHTATFASTSSLNVSGPQPKATAAAPAAGAVLGHVDDLAAKGDLPAIYCPPGASASVALGGLNVAGTVTVANAGNGLPLSLLNPYLCVSVIIALQGIFPSRN
jgi:microcystin-dependent protein